MTSVHSSTAKKTKAQQPSQPVLRFRTSKGSGEYPIFERFAKQCESKDSYWSHFFRSLINGKFPTGVIIKENILTYRSRRKETKMLELPKPENWEVLADFFRQNCEIMSSKDWGGEKDKENVIVSLTTAQINMKKRKERISTIPAYVLEVSKKYDLSSKEMLDVETLVRYHFNARTFRDGDVIHASNGNIKDINVLDFDTKERVFTVTREPRASREAREHYIDTMDYLFGKASIKKLEKRLSFDDEIKKYLRAVYCITASSGGNNALSEVHSVAPSIPEQIITYAGADDDGCISNED